LNVFTDDVVFVVWSKSCDTPKGIVPAWSKYRPLVPLVTVLAFSKNQNKGLPQHIL
jgi:hypothetical protein